MKDLPSDKSRAVESRAVETPAEEAKDEAKDEEEEDAELLDPEDEKRLAEAEEVRRSSVTPTTPPNGISFAQPPGWLGKATEEAERSFRKRAAAGEIA